MRQPEVLIVGGGLAGLCCAHQLQKDGISFQILEAAEEIGGRVRTDLVEGFQLDRGFQVFLAAYPEARRVLDYSALQLQSFYPGALVRVDGSFHRLADPWRRPLGAVATLASPVGSLADKLRIARLRIRSRASSLEELFHRPQTTTLALLQQAGFSQAMIDRFFRPFFGGIFLESRLETSSRMFDFVFRMMAEGDITLPAGGMQAIPQQLAATLPAGSIRRNTPVTQVGNRSVTLASGEQILGKAVVVAVEGSGAARLVPELPEVATRTVWCLYYAASEAPIQEPILILNGTGGGPINNLCFPSVVCPSYAPAGAALASVAVLEGPDRSESSVEERVRAQLGEWFGSAASGWRHLRTYRVEHALPRQELTDLEEPTRPVRVRPGLYVCGDHRDNASINGAMTSGKRAAEAVREDWCRPR